jgi:hypothetical protein
MPGCESSPYAATRHRVTRCAHESSIIREEKKMRKCLAIAVAVTLLLTAVLSGCSPQPTPARTPRPTITRAPPASPTSTQTAVEVEPTSSATPVPSPTAGPTVEPIPCAEAICLDASPMPVAADGTVTLEWNAPGASTVAVGWQNKQQEGIVHGGLSPAGSLSISIADTDIRGGPAVYVSVTAYYAEGEVESRFKELVIAVQARHAITAFSVSPQTVNPGDTVTLSWDVAGEVAGVSLYSLNERGQLDTPHSDLAPSGSVTFTVPASRRNRMGFYLSASDADGLWSSASTSVEIACPDVWYFPNPPADCPWPAHYTKMAVQHFERGVMIWTEWEDRIRVYYDDSQDVHLRSWSMHDNQWFEGMPESDPTIAAPPGYYQPVRGFGKLWREGSELGTSIRERVGWAIEREYGIERGAVQCDTSPQYSTCYVGDPRGLILVEEPESSGWYEWAGPDAIP